MDEEVAKLRLTAITVITVGGVTWGLGEVFIILESDSIVHQIFMAFVIGGMSAGAMAGLTFCLPAFYGFCVPTIMMTATKTPATLQTMVFFFLIRPAWRRI